MLHIICKKIHSFRYARDSRGWTQKNLNMKKLAKNGVLRGLNLREWGKNFEK